MKEEIATIKVLLSRTEAESFETKQSLVDAKGRLKKMKEKLHVDSSEIAKQYKTALKEQEQKLNEGEAHIKELQDEIKGMKENMSSKDSRMKSLEAKRLTKDQLAAMKKMMVSNL